MNITLRQLEYVKAAAACRSISKAAKRQHISQSSIGAAIDRVELEFGIKIFVRKPSKGLLPTRSGRQLLARINTLIGEVDSFAVQASGLQDQLAGDLNIGCFTPIAPHILPVILKKLTKNYPGISIHLHEGHLRRVQEFLLDGTVDVVLSYDLGLSDSVATTVLGQAPPHVILPKGDPLARKKKIDLRELREKPMILLDLPESRGYFELMFKTVGVQANIAHRTETYEMVRSMVGAGLGFSLLNLRPLIDNTYTGSEVVCIPLSNKIVSPNLILGQRKRETPTKLVEAFAASCRQYFQSPQANQHMVIT